MPSSKNTKTVIVLGNPRSGTSTVAGILNILGIKLSGNTDPSTVVPKGCFEDSDFTQMDGQILSASFGQKNENAFWLKLPSHEQILQQKEKFSVEIKSLLRKKSKESIAWGWKYPETMLTLDLYLEHIVNPYLIILERDPSEVASSMIKFHKLQKRHLNIGYTQILHAVNKRTQMMSQSLGRYPDIPKYFISFDKVVNDPIRESVKIANFLNLELTKKKEKDIKNFVIPRNKIWYERKKIEILAFVKKIIPTGKLKNIAKKYFKQKVTNHE